MGRFAGKVGFVNGEGHLVKGVWQKGISERPYKGEYLNQTQTIVGDDKVNNDISFSERISIVADSFAIENYEFVKYVEKKPGLVVEVTSVTDARPRLVLTLGGVYNGDRPPGDPPSNP